MIEIRNDEIGDAAGQRGWADRLANILVAAEPRLVGAKPCSGVNLGFRNGAIQGVMKNGR